MDYFEVIKKRRSVRSYRPDPVEPEKLNQILEAARLAPTACNLQAFKVIVIPTAGRKEELKTIYSREWLSEAPLVLCVCSMPGTAWSRRDGKSYADVDAAIVMDHIILAATALGLGTCWIGAFDARAAREVLGLDDSLEPVAFTPLGYANHEGGPVQRKPVSDLVINQ
jgi:nitroreductase